MLQGGKEEERERKLRTCAKSEKGGGRRKIEVTKDEGMEREREKSFFSLYHVCETVGRSRRLIPRHANAEWDLAEGQKRIVSPLPPVYGLNGMPAWLVQCGGGKKGGRKRGYLF